MGKKNPERRIGNTKMITCEEDVMKDVAEELGVDIDQVRDIVVGGQSEFTATAIRSQVLENVRWPYFGTFKIKATVMQKMVYYRGINKDFMNWFSNAIKEKNK